MKKITLETLEFLKNSAWFSNVGLVTNVVNSDEVIILSSWTEAIEYCSSAEWENICLEAANRLRRNILSKSQLRFNEWNDIAMRIKNATNDIVIEKTEQTIIDNHLPQSFIDTVQWDIMHVCMEAEYSDICRPGFYASQAFWYTKGHFPCGWEGDFPNGKIVIF